MQQSSIAILSTASLDRSLRNNGRYIIPDNIENGINKVLSGKDGNAIVEEYHRFRDAFKQYRQTMSPATIDYNSQKFVLNLVQTSTQSHLE